MSDQVIVIITIAVGVVILIAIWRYRTLTVRGRVAGAEGELSGQIDDKQSDSNANSPYHEVETKVGGNVSGSKVSSVGGDLIKNAGERSHPETISSNVTTSIRGDLKDSEVKSVGGDSANE
jgi:hypothetical protein